MSVFLPVIPFSKVITQASALKESTLGATRTEPGAAASPLTSPTVDQYTAFAKYEA
jgi:hypothetical protein